MKITKEMFEMSYIFGKKVFQKEIDISQASKLLSVETGMHSGSAKAYVGAFILMMNGEKYSRTLNTEATKYFLENINKDYGKRQLQIALNAVEQHTKYYALQGKGKLRSIEKLIYQFQLN
jgi:hypothetical protein